VLTPNLWNFSKMSVRSGDRQVEILEQFLRDLDECYGGDAPDVQEVKCSVRRLAVRVTRRRVENVAEVARQGKALQAHQLMKHHFPDVTLGTVQEVLQLIYLDAENLQSAIKFMGLVEQPQLLLGAFKVLLEAVQFRKHTDRIEMLLLRKTFNDLKIDRLVSQCHDKGLREMTNQVPLYCMQISHGITKELKNNDLSLVNQISRDLGHHLLSDLTMTVVVGYFVGANVTLDKLLKLIAVARKLPHTSNRCSLVAASWQHFYPYDPYKCYDARAMHLWTYARAVQEEKQFIEVEPEVRECFDTSIVKLSNGKENFKYIYQQFGLSTASGKVVPNEVSQMHLLNRDLIWLAAERGYEQCNGDVHQLSMSQQVCLVDNYEVLGCILCLMLREKVQKHSFEEFCVFAKARQLTEAVEGPVRSLERLLAEVPTCLRRLLWPDSNSPGFKIVNDFFQQPLCLQNSKVFLRGHADVQLWAVDIEPTTCLASIQLKSLGDAKLTLSAQDGDVCCSNNLKQVSWKIKAVDDEHFNIFTDKGNKKCCEKNFLIVGWR
jgi:hypothetical protein